jgi:hypothetical protein
LFQVLQPSQDMQHIERGWLLFLLTEAGSDGSGRVRVWRALKALGPAILRDGVYLLPARPRLEASLKQQELEVKRAGGQAFIFAFGAAPDDEPVLRRLLDRSVDFAALVDAVRRFESDDFPGLGETEARRGLRALQRDFKALVSIDYFPTLARDEAQAALARTDALFTQRFSPGEPHAAQRDIPRLDRADFQNRLWATRERMWVDRVASAWLIRTFIDPRATFAWLADARDCPPDALGFDFDGAPFTHVGDAVTFEVLMQSFGLGDDCGLALLGEMVRSLDITGAARSAEAAGFEAILTGARERCATDDELLAAIAGPLTFLHAAFARRANGAGRGAPAANFSGRVATPTTEEQL